MRTAHAHLWWAFLDKERDGVRVPLDELGGAVVRRLAPLVHANAIADVRVRQFDVVAARKHGSEQRIAHANDAAVVLERLHFANVALNGRDDCGVRRPRVRLDASGSGVPRTGDLVVVPNQLVNRCVRARSSRQARPQ